NQLIIADMNGHVIEIAQHHFNIGKHKYIVYDPIITFPYRDKNKNEYTIELINYDYTNYKYICSYLDLLHRCECDDKPRYKIYKGEKISIYDELKLFTGKDYFG